ncbi:MAG TPA: penicillin-binding protein 2 [Clostridia bacterium]|nr:penicillin-binding protein 2 [Clostridia bacterium]
MEKQNRRIIHVLIFMSFLFLSIIVYLTYFETFEKDRILTSSYNRRQWEQEDTTQRGSILDRNGTMLAYSKGTGSKQERIYPYGRLYSQVIGYNSRAYGKSQLEAQYNNELLNIWEFSPIAGLKNILSGEPKAGDNLYLTLDHKLQKKAEQLLGSKNGAIVVMRPKTGEVLAMVSKPDFDPNSAQLAQNWQDMVESDVHPFLPRATQGVYAPGSTFKVLVSAAALGNDVGGGTYTDRGSIVINGMEIDNYRKEAYGKIDMTQALAVSSNVVFAQIGVELGERNIRDIAARAGMNRDIPFDLNVSVSRFPYGAMDKTDLAAVGIGQGRLQVTPLFMAMVASGIANEGVMMKPYLVDRVVSPSDVVIRTTQPEVFSRLISPEIAADVNEMMQSVVTAGTGKSAAIRGVKVAGKTGTAQNELSGVQKNKEHSWFIGFAPADNPQVAVAVLLEYGGSTGGKAAAPIAREMLRLGLSEG